MRNGTEDTHGGWMRFGECNGKGLKEKSGWSGGEAGWRGQEKVQVECVMTSIFLVAPSVPRAQRRGHISRHSVPFCRIAREGAHSV